MIFHTEIFHKKVSCKSAILDNFTNSVMYTETIQQARIYTLDTKAITPGIGLGAHSKVSN